MRKVIGSYKDYSQDNMFWSKAFFNYTIILIELFDAIISSLYLALDRFHYKIIDFSIVYEWQRGVLPLILDLHTHII